MILPILDQALIALPLLIGAYITLSLLKLPDFSIESAYLAGGSDALRNAGGKNRLQRCFRDIHAGSQHRHTDHNIIGDCGTVLLGTAKENLIL